MKESSCLYFIDNEFYFNGFAPYGEMYTDVESFHFLKGSIECSSGRDFRPDIIHCHDWQTGLIPIFLNLIFGIPMNITTRNQDCDD